MSGVRRAVVLAASAAVAAVPLSVVSGLSPVAAAQPQNPAPSPDTPGFVNVIPDLEPGSFSYPYNVIEVGPPPATDSRGTRISAGVDQDSKSVGLPGSSLGNSQQAGGPLVSSNTRNSITGGLEPAAGANPGIDVRAGTAALPSAETANGLPPQTPIAIESSQPDDLSTPGGYPAPVLETPGTVREGPAGVFGAQPQ